MGVWSLNKDELFLLKVVENTRSVPRIDDLLHVSVTRKEANHTIRNDCTHLCDERSIVSDDCLILSVLERRVDRNLVVSLCHDL